MKPQPPAESPTDDLFRHRLENLIDRRHELVRLAALIDWDHFDTQWGLSTHNGNTVTIDNAGNTTADPAESLSFTYDDHNRMVEAYVSSSLVESYVYDGRGQRVIKQDEDGPNNQKLTTVFHYGLNGELIGETVRKPNGKLHSERDYVWLDTLLLAQSERTFKNNGSIDTSQFVYIHADQLNTPRLASDSSGDVVWRWDSDAFGVGEADLDPDSDNEDVSVRLRFPGQYFDEETGLHYNYFRDYDPATGRYVESDPIGLIGGINTFAYASNQPLTNIDPAGLFKLEVSIEGSIPLLGGFEIGLFTTDGEGDIGCNSDLGLFFGFSKPVEGPLLETGIGKLKLGTSIGIARRGGRESAREVSGEVSGGFGIGAGVGGFRSGNGGMPDEFTIESGTYGIGASQNVDFSLSVGDIARGVAAIVTGDRSQRVLGADPAVNSCGCRK